MPEPTEKPTPEEAAEALGIGSPKPVETTPPVPAEGAPVPISVPLLTPSAEAPPESAPPQPSSPEPPKPLEPAPPPTPEPKPSQPPPETPEQRAQREAEEAQRWRQAEEVARSLAREKAERLAKADVEERRRGFLERLSRGILGFFGRQTAEERAMTDNLVREYELREEIAEVKSQLSAATSEQARQALQARLTQLEQDQQRRQQELRGRQIEFTPQERKVVMEMAAILGKAETGLTAEEKGKVAQWKSSEWFEKHPTFKALLYGAGTGTAAGVATHSTLSLGIRRIVSWMGGPAVIGSMVTGAVIGGLREKYVSHSVEQWLKDLGLNVADSVIENMSIQELARVVGVTRNVIENRAVRGDRLDFANFLVQFQKATESLRSKARTLAQVETVAGTTEKDKVFLGKLLNERLDDLLKTDQEVDELLKARLSDQERVVYERMERAKGLRAWGKAALGAATGLAAWEVFGLIKDMVPQMQFVVDRFNTEHLPGIAEQRERAARAVLERGATALGFQGDTFQTFIGHLRDAATPQDLENLVKEAATKGNIDLGVQVDGMRFVDWLQSHKDWFNSLPQDIKVQAISHPGLVPELYARGTKEFVPYLIGLGGLATGLLARVGTEQGARREEARAKEEHKRLYEEKAKVEKPAPPAAPAAPAAKVEEPKKLEEKKPEEKKPEVKYAEFINHVYEKGGVRYMIKNVTKEPGTDQYYFLLRELDEEDRVVAGKRPVRVAVSDLGKEGYAWQHPWEKPEEGKKVVKEREEGEKRRREEEAKERKAKAEQPEAFRAESEEEIDEKMAPFGDRKIDKVYVNEKTGERGRVALGLTEEGEPRPVWNVMSTLWERLKGHKVTTKEAESAFREWLKETSLREATSEENAAYREEVKKRKEQEKAVPIDAPPTKELNRVQFGLRAKTQEGAPLLPPREIRRISFVRGIPLPNGESVMTGELWRIHGAPYEITQIVQTEKGWTVVGELRDQARFKQRPARIEFLAEDFAKRAKFEWDYQRAYLEPKRQRAEQIAAARRRHAEARVRTIDIGGRKFVKGEVWVVGDIPYQIQRFEDDRTTIMARNLKSRETERLNRLELYNAQRAEEKEERHLVYFDLPKSRRAVIRGEVWRIGPDRYKVRDMIRSKEGRVTIVIEGMGEKAGERLEFTPEEFKKKAREVTSFPFSTKERSPR